MKAAFLEAPRKIVVRDLDMPTPSVDEVLVRLRATGICGSDVHYYEEGRIGDYIAKQPLILGHETSGEVVEIGSGVCTLQVGDRVVIEPGIPCRRCRFCRSGRYNLCPDVKFMGTPPVHGAFVEYVAHPADFAFRIPPGLTFEEASLCEPLAVALQCVERSAARVGGSAAIMGAGPIGLLILQVLLAAGTTRVSVVDPVRFRLDIARDLGTSAAFLPDEVDMIESYDTVFDASGSGKAVQLALDVVRRGGKVVLVGLSPYGDLTVSLDKAVDKELDLVGVFRYANQFENAIALLSAGVISSGKMITATFDLADARNALSHVSENRSSTIKAILLNSNSRDA